MLLQTCSELNFQVIGDSRGSMVVVEGNQTVPFEIKRMFYIYGTEEGIVRGQHANKNSEFALICLNGTCKVRISDGVDELIVDLDKPMKGVYIPKMLWKDMYDFSDNAVLLVLASTHYDKTEYIRNFEEYKKIMLEQQLSTV